LTPNILPNSLFCFFKSSEIGVFLGKSSSTRIAFFVAHALNSSFTNTSLTNFLHHPHQSLPVKKKKSGFPVCTERLIALLISVCHL